MLRYRADLRTIFFVAAYFALTAALWLVLPGDLLSDHGAIRWELAIPLFIAVCVTSFMGAVSTHNAVHSPIFKKRGLNKLWQVSHLCQVNHLCPVSKLWQVTNLPHKSMLITACFGDRIHGASKPKRFETPCCLSAAS